MTKQRLIQLAAALATVAALVPAYGAGARTAGAPLIEGGRLAGLPYHVVAPGESVAMIAQRYGVDTATITSANGMTDGGQLYRGARILLAHPNPGTSGPGGGQAPAGAGASGQGTYTVRAGDSLSRIAQRQGTTVAALVAANGIAVDSIILPGQQLVVPAAAPVASAAPSGQGTYTVRPGDSFYRIASTHGVTVAALVAANGLSVSHVLMPGDELTVPARGTTSAATAGGPAALTCPVPGGSFQFDWGFPREGGRFHHGLDVFAPTGTPIRAPVGGTVTVGTDSTPGHYAVLRGHDGWQYYAAHLSAFGASGTVQAGEVIGYVGASGNAVGTDPHLHLEMRPFDGRPQNPYPFIRTACGG